MPALSTDPTFLLNQARARLRYGEPWSAVVLLQEILRAHEPTAQVLDLLGNTLMELGRQVEGARHLCRSFVMQPEESQQPRMRGIAYYILGDLNGARAVYQNWIARDPDNATAHFFLAALSGKDVPARAGDSYIRPTFDEMADRFEEHVRGLAYRVPEEMAHMLASHHAPQGNWRILDGGCGTGLVGRCLRPWARQMYGVDLSFNMVGHARNTGFYEFLEQAEISSFLAQCQQRFNLIAYADMLIYFGDLGELFQRSAALLEPGGRIMFSTELPSQGQHVDQFHLNASGHYQHSESHVAQCLRDAGLEVVAQSRLVVRNELDRALQGQLVLAQLAPVHPTNQETLHVGPR